MEMFLSRSPEETARLGEEWGRAAAVGWVVGLRGDLGAGKTELVKGFARGLDVKVRVQSPTFALVNHYTGGRLDLFHLDLYRLDSTAQIVGAGLEEYLGQPAGVAVIEWIDRWLGLDPAAFGARRPRRYRHVWIETVSEDERRITYEDFGS